jgi:hypothetical protein
MNVVEVDKGLHEDVVNFLTAVAHDATIEDYAVELAEEFELDEYEAMNMAYREYNGDVSIQNYIVWAREIIRKHRLEPE